MYGTYKSATGLIVLFVICIIACCILKIIKDKNYQETDGNITYRQIINGSVGPDCDLSNPQNCRYVDEYNDKNSKHYAIPEPISSVVPSVGPHKIYYENNNPPAHVITPTSPSNILYMILCCITIIFIIGIINLYFITHNRGYGAFMGGIEATQDILGRIAPRK
jgi:hypothetical protein